MTRPRLRRRIRFRPHAHYFKPRGIPMRHLAEVILRADELEALKLYDVDGLDQTAAAKQMNVSQPTFHRVLTSARKKVAKALIEGMAIRLEKTSGENPPELP